MPKRIFEILHYLDLLSANVLAGLKLHTRGIWIFTFHSLFQSQEELERKQIFPHEGITIDQFADLVAYFKKEGFTFISPEEISLHSQEKGRYALLSFDDGYFNNTRALEVLAYYQVPALFSVSTAFIEASKAFWWDVHFREEARKEKDFRTILAEQNELKELSFERIDQEIRNRYGEYALDPIGDLDRPLSPEELIAFAESPWVFIGNHTTHHAILPNYSLRQVKDQVLGAQSYLKELLGKPPAVMVYPNGNWTPEIVQLIAELGFQSGLSMGPGMFTSKDFEDPRNALILPRFQVFGPRSIHAQAKILQYYNGGLRAFKNTLLYPLPKF